VVVLGKVIISNKVSVFGVLKQIFSPSAKKGKKIEGLYSSEGNFRADNLLNLPGSIGVLSGEVISGQIAKGMVFILNGKEIEVKSIGRGKDAVVVANPGDKVWLGLNTLIQEGIKQGDTIRIFVK